MRRQVEIRHRYRLGCLTFQRAFEVFCGGGCLHYCQVFDVHVVDHGYVRLLDTGAVYVDGEDLLAVL